MPVALHKLQRTVALNVANPSSPSSQSYDSQSLFTRHGACFWVSVSKRWDLRERTTKFAEDVCGFCRQLPDQREAQEVASQLRRAATGVATNYRAARRGRSDADFIAKIAVVIEEADEAMYWIEHVSAIARNHDLEPLRQEANELVAIFTTAHKTAKANLEKKKALRRRRTRPT